MAYIGNIPAEAYTNTVKDSFNGTGSATAFTLSQPTVTNDVRVVVENVVQDPTVAYSVSGTTLTFTSAPPSGTANIYVVHLGAAVMTAIPPSEIADATTFASSVTVQGAFTSLGIDDNANATAITIDSSENVLVGTTDPLVGSGSGSNTQGIALSSGSYGGYLTTSRQDNPTASFNRKGTSGGIVDLRHDGSTVGTIGSRNGESLMIGSTYGTEAHLNFGNGAVFPVTNSGIVKDSQITLGASTARFKDLYLSGGVFLGGTGAANKLDDYEEGTWTPSLYAVTGGAITVSATTTGKYTKIGRLVHVSFSIGPFSVSGGTGGATINISGLPFTTQGSGLDSNGSVLGSNGISWSRTDFVALRTYDVSTLGFLVSNNGGSWLWETVSAFTGSNQHVNGTITYMTTA